MVQWDTSEHDWLGGRGPQLYLIHMIDDATSELTARFGHNRPAIPTLVTQPLRDVTWTNRVTEPRDYCR